MEKKQKQKKTTIQTTDNTLSIISQSGYSVDIIGPWSNSPTAAQKEVERLCRRHEGPHSDRRVRKKTSLSQVNTGNEAAAGRLGWTPTHRGGELGLSIVFPPGRQRWGQRWDGHDMGVCGQMESGESMRVRCGHKSALGERSCEEAAVTDQTQWDPTY